VQWLNERQKMKLMQHRKLEEPSEPVKPVAEESKKDPSEPVKPIAEAPKKEAQVAQKPIQKETKAKNLKREKNAVVKKIAKVDELVPVSENLEKQKPPMVADCIRETLKETLNETVTDCIMQKQANDTHVRDFGFHEVMPSKKAARETCQETRRRNKAKESEQKPKLEAKVVPTVEAPIEKPKPHCPPPSFTPAQLEETQKPKPHCPPPSFMPTQLEETQKEGTAKEPEAIHHSQKQLTPIDKEILNLEKKVREIEKLKEIKATGAKLEKKQEEKIERAGEIGLKLSQLYSEKFIEEQKNKMVGDIEKSQPEVMDIQTPQQLPQAPKKKRANKKSEKNSHVPVVVPPRVQAQATDCTTQLQMAAPGMWAPVMEVPVQQEESEDFEMTPLDVPENWRCHLSAQFKPRNLALQFDLMVEDPICEATQGQPQHKNDCWEWVTKGVCPRAEFCRWNHRPLGNGAAETSMFALNLSNESDSE